MYSHRDALGSDFEQIVYFPQNEDELFFMFPTASYPLTVHQLTECALSRIEPTIFLFKDHIIGYANIIKIEDRLFGSIGNIIVSPDYRGQGVGRYILDTMSNKLKDNFHVKELRLACFSTNIAGLMLYQKYGFSTYDIDIKVDNKGNTVLLLRLKKSL